MSLYGSLANTVGKTVLPTGSILQVSQVTYTDVISATGGTFADIPNLQITITPTASTSKMLLIPNFQVGSAGATYQIMFRAYRVVGGTETWIGASVSSGSRTQTSFVVGQQYWDNYDILHTSWQYLDSPATTSAITYKFKWADPRDSSTHYIGRSYYDADSSAVSRSTSIFTVMEIAG